MNPEFYRSQMKRLEAWITEWNKRRDTINSALKAAKHELTSIGYAVEEDSRNEQYISYIRFDEVKMQVAAARQLDNSMGSLPSNSLTPPQSMELTSFTDKLIKNYLGILEPNPPTALNVSFENIQSIFYFTLKKVITGKESMKDPLIYLKNPLLQHSQELFNADLNPACFDYEFLDIHTPHYVQIRDYYEQIKEKIIVFSPNQLTKTFYYLDSPNELSNKMFYYLEEILSCEELCFFIGSARGFSPIHDPPFGKDYHRKYFYLAVVQDIDSSDFSVKPLVKGLQKLDEIISKHNKE